jgi:hypothetical protein
VTEQIEPVKTLTSARNTLIAERRALAVAIALGYRRRRTDDNHTNEMREAFVGLQNTIEAIDRAIAHEKLIANELPESFVVPTLETVPSAETRSESTQNAPPSEVNAH